MSVIYTAKLLALSSPLVFVRQYRLADKKMLSALS